MGGASRQIVELKHLHAARQGFEPHRVGFAARLFWSAEHASHLVASVDKGLQHGLAEILLSDDDDFHGGLARFEVVARQMTLASRSAEISPAE